MSHVLCEHPSSLQSTREAQNSRMTVWGQEGNTTESGRQRGVPGGCDLPKHLLVVYHHWK